ncbi:MAG: sugar phosphate isomerase/epimerase [Methylacidiphilales bacterium]|nr:sugar phosphate isomerase/epimerase [Candidatus Methylacidiphilales bacterium]
MKVGICTSIDNASVLAKSAFDYLEENVQGFLVPEAPEADFAPRLQAAKRAALPVLAANCFLPAALKCTGPEVNPERLTQYAETAFRRAQEAGIRTIVFGSGGSRQIPEGFDREQARDQFLSCVRRIAPLAERYGVMIVIEPLNKKECNFINSLAEGAAMVAADHTHLRLLADIYHMLVEQESPDEIIKYGRWIQHVHVAEREGRMAPGTKGEDFGPYLRALKKIDYRGAISFECGWKQFPEEAAASLNEFRRQVSEAGLA